MIRSSRKDGENPLHYANQVCDGEVMSPWKNLHSCRIWIFHGQERELHSSVWLMWGENEFPLRHRFFDTLASRMIEAFCFYSEFRNKICCETKLDMVRSQVCGCRIGSNESAFSLGSHILWITSRVWCLGCVVFQSTIVQPSLGKVRPGPRRMQPDLAGWVNFWPDLCFWQISNDYLNESHKAPVSLDS